MSNYLYIIHASDNIYKIGITTDVRRRLAELQTGNPYQLTVYLGYEFSNAAHIEKVLHDKLGDRRMSGEWFKMSAHELEEVVQVCRLLNGRAMSVFPTAPVAKVPVVGKVWIESKKTGGNALYLYQRWREMGDDGKIVKRSKYLSPVPMSP